MDKPNEIEELSIPFTQEQLFVLIGELYCHRKFLVGSLYRSQQKLSQAKKDEER